MPHRALLLLTGLALGLGLASPAQADPYRWCAEYAGGSTGGGGTNCGFVTLEQCRATVSGIGGICRINTFYSGDPYARPVRAKKPFKKRVKRYAR